MKQFALIGAATKNLCFQYYVKKQQREMNHTEDV